MPKGTGTRKQRVALLDGAVDASALGSAAVTTTKIDTGAVTLAKVDSTVFAEATVTIATAAVLTLFDTPVTLVAAPGAGFVLEFLSAQFFFDYNSVAYVVDAGDDLVVKYTNASGGLASKVLETTGFLDATADSFRFLSRSDSVAPVDNAPLVLHMLTSNPTTGNSPLKVRTRYRTRPTTF